MTAFVAIIAIALVMVAGMAYDGGGIISAQGQTRSNAAKAARAGAQEVDITSLRSTGKTVLDPARAKQSALAYLAQAGAAGTVTVDGPNITVTVTMNQPMHILPVPDRTVVATETATALHGKSP
jgi:uncharacterized protein YbjT (DUF2867 family)